MSDQFSPKPNVTLGRYQHYKGNFYDVIDLACHSETLEWYVVYKSLDDYTDTPNLWIRPYEMFIETVEINSVKIPRFKK